MSSPYKSATDSPGRQLLWELSHLGLSNQEEFHARLDQEYREREVVHRKELAAAVAKHTRVRESAENARKELELRIEEERQRREDEERQELRQREQEQAARELSQKRAERERLRQAQLEEQKQEQARLVFETARLQREVKEREDAAARKEAERKAAIAQQQAQEAQEAGRKANEARIAEQRSRLASTQTSLPAITEVHPTPAPRSNPNPECEAEHQRYLAIHKSLKDLRQFMVVENRKNDELKQNMGDIRRQIKKSVGQLTTGPNANKQPVSF